MTPTGGSGKLLHETLFFVGQRHNSRRDPNFFFFCAVCLARNNKTDTPSDLPSGTNTQDSLEELNDAMYFQHRDNKQSKEKEDPLVEEYLGPRPRRRATRQVRQVGGRRRRLLWLELIRAR